MKTKMKFAPSTAKARKAVRKFHDKKLTWGHIQPIDSGFLIYANQKKGSSALPDFCANLIEIEQAICVVKISDTTLFILIKESIDQIAEYVIDVNSTTSVEFKALTTHLFAIQGKIDAYKVLTNISYNKVDADNTAFGKFISLPVKTKNISKADWLNDYDKFKTDFKHLKDAKEIQYSAKLKIGVVALFASVIATSYGVDAYQKELARKEAIASAKANKPAPKIDKGQVSVSNYLNRDGANMLEALHNISKQLKMVYTLTNWEAVGLTSSIKNNGQSILIKLQPINANSVNEIVEFASKYNYGVDVDPNNAFLEVNVPKHPIISDMAYFHLGSYQIYMNTTIPNYWDNTSITIEDDPSLKHAKWAFNLIDIKLPDSEPSDIASMGSMFYAFPIGFESINMERKPDESPRWSTNIKLKIGGVKHNG